MKNVLNAWKTLGFYFRRFVALAKIYDLTKTLKWYLFYTGTSFGGRGHFRLFLEKKETRKKKR